MNHNNENELPIIKFNHYKRFLTTQPYFVWHNEFNPNNLQPELKNISNIEILKDNSYSNDELEDDDILATLVSIFSGEEDLEQFSKIDVIKNSFDIVVKQFQDYIVKDFAAEKVYFVKAKSNDQAISETLEAINLQNYEVIINPVFKYRNAIARPMAYFPKKQKISNINVSSKTKLNNYFRAYYDYWITKKALGNNSIHDYSLFVIDIVHKYQPKIVPITETYQAATLKSGKSLPEKYKGNVEMTRCFFHKGVANDSHCDSEDFNRIATFLESKKIDIKPNYTLYFDEIDDIIDKINSYQNLEYFTDINPLQYWSDTLEKYEFPAGNDAFAENVIEILHPEIFGITGNLIKFEKKINYIEQKRLYLDTKNSQQINCNEIMHLMQKANFFEDQNSKNAHILLSILKKDEIKIVPDKLKTFIDLLTQPNEIIVWYDFESFSFPFPVLENSKPYSQIVFQVSIIKTKNGAIFSKENFVYDPLKINNDVFKNIIDDIYANKANKFVVFNKNFENTRLKEMVELFQKVHDPQARDYSKKVAHITDHTVDLMECFANRKANDHPIIFIPEIKCYFSIKKIEKYITKHKIDLEHKITPYSELEIQNGMMAMNVAGSRYLGGIGDNEWNNEKVPLLKQYCENDVMAMLMVFDFMKLQYQKFAKQQK
ncbi:DUF2779 domain-containing protein [Candidatus Mycoplasma pogonae]